MVARGYKKLALAPSLLELTEADLTSQAFLFRLSPLDRSIKTSVRLRLYSPFIPLQAHAPSPPCFFYSPVNPPPRPPSRLVNSSPRPHLPLLPFASCFLPDPVVIFNSPMAPSTTVPTLEVSLTSQIRMKEEEGRQERRGGGGTLREISSSSEAIRAGNVAPASFPPRTDLDLLGELLKGV